MMNKTDLIRIVATRTNSTRHQTRETVNSMLECIQKVLGVGDKIVLRGFGTFGVKEIAPRRIWNPVTDKYMDIESRKKVRFYESSILKRSIQK